MMTVNSVLVLHIAWKSDFVVYCLSLTHRKYWPWFRQIQQRTLVYCRHLLLFGGGGEVC